MPKYVLGTMDIGSGAKKYLTHGLSLTILVMVVNLRAFGSQPAVMRLSVKF